jgi:DtxR family transcriptional regulator, Mn-dependent transcriptional regulator
MNSRNREDYLRGLYILEERNKKIKSIDLAKYLNVSKPSVSEMMRVMDREGLVQYKRYSELKFTPKGRMLAAKLTYKHRIIETFLKNILKIKKSTIHEEAHKLEHAFSDESIERIRKLLGNPRFDPHGRPITK